MKITQTITIISVLIASHPLVPAVNNTLSMEGARASFLASCAVIQNKISVSSILQDQLELAQTIYQRELKSNLDPEMTPKKSPQTLQPAIDLFKTEEDQEDKKTQHEERYTWYNRCLDEQRAQITTLKSLLQETTKPMTLDSRRALFARLYDTILNKAETCANTMRIYGTPAPSFKSSMFPTSLYNPLVGACCFMAATLYQKVQRKKSIVQHCFKAASLTQIAASSYHNLKSHQQKMQVYRKIIQERNRLT